MSGAGAWEVRTAESKGRLKEVQCRVASDDVIVETCSLLRGSGQSLASSFKKKKSLDCHTDILKIQEWNADSVVTLVSVPPSCASSYTRV